MHKPTQIFGFITLGIAFILINLGFFGATSGNQAIIKLIMPSIVISLLLFTISKLFGLLEEIRDRLPSKKEETSQIR